MLCGTKRFVGKRRNGGRWFKPMRYFFPGQSALLLLIVIDCIQPTRGMSIIYALLVRFIRNFDNRRDMFDFSFFRFTLWNFESSLGFFEYPLAMYNHFLDYFLFYTFQGRFTIFETWYRIKESILKITGMINTILKIGKSSFWHMQRKIQ